MTQKDQPVLLKKRQELFDNKSLKVPKLGLDGKRKELLAKLEAGLPQEPVKQGPSPSEALMKLGARINQTKSASAKNFWSFLKEVEDKGRRHFKDMPLVVEQ